MKEHTRKVSAKAEGFEKVVELGEEVPSINFLGLFMIWTMAATTLAPKGEWAFFLCQSLFVALFLMVWGFCSRKVYWRKIK